MFKVKQSLCEANPDGAGGTKDDTTALQKKIDELTAETGRLVKHNEKLLGEKKDVQTKLKELDDKVKSFGDLDADAIAKMKKLMDGSEEAKLLAEGKIDDVVTRRMEKKLLEIEGKTDEFKTEAESWKTKYSELNNKFNTSTINAEIRKAAEVLDVLPSAIDDVVARSVGKFSIGEDGKIESRDKDGNIVKVGNKALTPELFVKGLQDTAAHFWKPSSSAGATGKHGKDGGVNPFIKGKHYNLTEQAKVQRSDPELAAQYRKEAETV